MGSPFIGEIRMFAGNFAPQGWSFCDGSLLSISQNDVLFALIGTTYGGDGQSTFALPDLRGRLPLHQGNGFVLAQTGGAETVTLTVNQIPAHIHSINASGNAGVQAGPVGILPASSNAVSLYKTPGALTAMNSQAIGSTGGSQAHNNIQPYLCVDFIISLFGIFPSP
jgi:microcystin-dependent protein